MFQAKRKKNVIENEWIVTEKLEYNIFPPDVKVYFCLKGDTFNSYSLRELDWLNFDQEEIWTVARLTYLKEKRRGWEIW